MLVVYASRYSKNGNKTYFHKGEITIKELEELFKKIKNTPNHVWYVDLYYMEDGWELIRGE